MSDPTLWNTSVQSVTRALPRLGIWIAIWKIIRQIRNEDSNASNATRHSPKWQICYGTYKRFTAVCVRMNAKCAIKPSPNRETSKDINWRILVKSHSSVNGVVVPFLSASTWRNTQWLIRDSDRTSVICVKCRLSRNRILLSIWLRIVWKRRTSRIL